MPIRPETKMSLEFTCEAPLLNGKEGEGRSYPLKFYHTAEFGPTIAFLDIDGKVEFELPALMFLEISELLVECGAMDGRIPMVKPQNTNHLSKSPARKLGLPTISKQVLNKASKEIVDSATEVGLEGEPEEQFIPPGAEEVQDVEPVEFYSSPAGDSNSGNTTEEDEGDAQQEDPEKPLRQPRPAPRTKIDKDQLNQMRSSANPERRIKPLT